MDCLDEVEGSDPRALVWRSAGDIFTGGVDVNAFQRVVDAGPEDANRFATPLIDAVRRLESVEIPTVALVHGLCLTAGLEIALGCDIIWAEESSQFGLVEAVVGLTPGAGGTQRLSRLVGPSRAKELMFTGRMVKADEALAIGLVDRVFPAEQVIAEATAWAAQFVGAAPYALRAIKDAVDRGLETDLETGLGIERQHFAGVFATEDRTTGMTSFIENGPGKAVFNGR